MMEQFVRTLHAAAASQGSDVEFLFPSSGLASQLFGATAGQITSVLSEHLTPFIREHRIDLVHSHNLVGVHLLAIDNWARRTSTPHLVTIHDVPQTGFDRRAAGALQHTRMATQLKYNRTLLQQLTAEPISILQVGIPFEHFPVCPPATDRCVALPARISPAKSIVEAVDSLGQLAVEGSPVRLLLSDLRRPAFDEKTTRMWTRCSMPSSAGPVSPWTSCTMITVSPASTRKRPLSSAYPNTTKGSASPLWKHSPPDGR